MVIAFFPLVINRVATDFSGYTAYVWVCYMCESAFLCVFKKKDFFFHKRKSKKVLLLKCTSK